jgi:hypothetical protein
MPQKNWEIAGAVHLGRPFGRRCGLCTRCTTTASLYYILMLALVSLTGNADDPRGTVRGYMYSPVQRAFI